MASIATRTIALPFYNNLSEQEIDYVVENLSNILRQSKGQSPMRKEKTFEKLYGQANELKNLISGFVRYLLRIRLLMEQPGVVGLGLCPQPKRNGTEAIPYIRFFNHRNAQ